MTRRLSTKQREELYCREVEKAQGSGRGDYPICNLCNLPITPDREWDVSHEAHKPRWLGGEIEGLAHRRCNRIWNNQHDTPLYAKSERQRRRAADITRSAKPMPFGRDDPIKMTIARGPVDRRTGEPWRGRS